MSLGEATRAARDERRATDDRDAYDAASGAVVDVVTSAKGIDPVTGEFCLHDYLDPDALDALVASGTAAMTLTITLDDVTVTIDGDGCVTVVDEDSTIE